MSTYKEDDVLVIIPYTKVVKETSKATLFDCERDEVWLPISQIKVDKGTKKIELPEWLFNNKFPNG